MPTRPVRGGLGPPRLSSEMTTPRTSAALLCLFLVASVPVRAATAPVEEAAQARFDVWEFQIEGSDLIPATAIERAVYPHLGEDRTIDDVEAARTAVETAFREAGYATVLVNIPEQDVENGVVRFEVLEGRVARLRVVGSRYFSLGRIREAVPALASGAAPNLPEVQQQLAALNKQSADRKVSPVLKPGRLPGTVDVDLKVEDKLPLHGSLELNDDFIRNTSRLRLNGSLRYDNLWQREHSVGFSFQLTPENPSEVKVFSGTYLFRPDLWDLLVVLYGVKSASDVTSLGSSGGGVGVIGNGVIAGTRVIKPLPTVERVFHNLTVGLDYKDFQDTVSPVGGTGFATPISYTKFNVGYGGFVLGEANTLRFNLDANVGVRGMGNTFKEFTNKRFQAKPGYLYLRGDGSWEGALPGSLLPGAELLVAFAGQLSSGPIIGNEQFSIGGAGDVRGYFATQGLVDNGVTGRVELRSPSLIGDIESPWLNSLKLVTFVEAGQGAIVDPLPGQDEAFTLAATGLGLRLAALHGVESRVDWAVPLVENQEIRAFESRFHFSFGYEF